MTFFSGKISILRQKFLRTFFSLRPDFSNFPFSRPKFLMTFILVIAQVFRIFPFFSQIFRIYPMLNVVYDPFLTIYWGTDAWAVPHLKFWEDRPPVPSRSPPLLV